MLEAIRWNGDALKAITCYKLHCQRGAKAWYRNCVFLFLFLDQNRRVLERRAGNAEYMDSNERRKIRALYSTIINPLRAVMYGHYEETEKPLQSFDWYSEIGRGE